MIVLVLKLFKEVEIVEFWFGFFEIEIFDFLVCLLFLNLCGGCGLVDSLVGVVEEWR